MKRFRTVVGWPWAIVAAAVIWNLVTLRSETVAVPYLNDSSMHEQMVRSATAALRAGHLPLTTWFPYLGEGSPQFLHYQSLPAMLAGALGLITGPNVAFRWTLYLLLSLWPVSVYAAARLFGAGRAASAAAAVMAPFLSSATGVGYEPEAYLWIGYGVWTQLWAMFTLPLAWGCSWQAVRFGRHRFAAVALIALTCAFHFETGYVALIPLIFWPLVAGGRIRAQFGRAAVLAVGAGLSVAWVIVPLIDQSRWAAVNQVLKGTPLENGYGIGQVLSWLGTGRLLDSGRFPVISLLALVGAVLACVRWRRDPGERALLVALVISLLLSFGPATFHALADIIPGHADLFFRRFEMGVQLTGVLMAGRGAAWLAAQVVRLTLMIWPPHAAGLSRGLADRRGGLLAGLGLAAAAIVLFPAWHQIGDYTSANAAEVSHQRAADTTQGLQLDELLAQIPPDTGRVYAGMPSNFGADFTVGAVPVFKYLESRDVDEVGYTLRTASLMTDPEYDLDQDNPSDYRLFGIHYLILPSGSRAPVTARLTRQIGKYALWTLPGPGGVLSVGTVVGTLSADRADVATQTLGVLESDQTAAGRYDLVRFDGATGATGATGADDAAGGEVDASGTESGRVLAQTDRLADGRASGTVELRRPGVVVLSASFDPGWKVTVDGRPVHTEMVAPALVAARVPAGRHTVVFSYHGYPGYPWLFALAAVTLLALLVRARVFW